MKNAWNMYKKFIIIFFVFIYISLGQIPINSCGIILSAPGEYVLTQDLVGLDLIPNSLPFNCIVISGNNITLSGEGHNISGAFQVAVIYVEPGGFHDITIRDINIFNSLAGGITINAIGNYPLGQLPLTNFVHILNANILSGCEPIWIMGCKGCSVINSTIYPYPNATQFADSGMLLDGNTQLTIIGNIVNSGFYTAALEFVDLTNGANVHNNILFGGRFAGGIGTVYNGDLIHSHIYHNQIISNFFVPGVGTTGTGLGIYWTHWGGVSELNEYLGDMGIEFFDNVIEENTINAPFCLFFPNANDPISSTTLPMWNGNNGPVGITSGPAYAWVYDNKVRQNICSDGTNGSITFIGNK